MMAQGHERIEILINKNVLVVKEEIKNE